MSRQGNQVMSLTYGTYVDVEFKEEVNVDVDVKFVDEVSTGMNINVFPLIMPSPNVLSKRMVKNRRGNKVVERVLIQTLTFTRATIFLIQLEKVQDSPQNIFFLEGGGECLEYSRGKRKSKQADTANISPNQKL